MRRTLTEIIKEIRNYLEENPGATTYQIVHRLNIHPYKLRHILKTMHEEGCISTRGKMIFWEESWQKEYEKTILED